MTENLEANIDLNLGGIDWAAYMNEDVLSQMDQFNGTGDPSKVPMASKDPMAYDETKVAPKPLGESTTSEVNDELAQLLNHSPGPSGLSDHESETASLSQATDEHVNTFVKDDFDFTEFFYHDVDMKKIPANFLKCDSAYPTKIPMTPPKPSSSDEDMCEVQHPVHKMPYLVSKKLFCNFLEQSGKPVKTYSKDSDQITNLVAQFCDHAHIEYMTAEKARMIKNSGYEIDVLSTKKGKSGKYACLFCPLIGSMTKSFPNKENLIRHNALHLRYNKFRCGYCDYKHFRKDTIVQHINLKHPDKKHESRIFNLQTKQKILNY